MPRVHQGLKNGRMGIWVSAPGFDASAEVGKFLLNSDWQFMRIHQQNSGTRTATGLPTPAGQYLYDDFTITFPDLGYIPMAIFSNSAPLTPGFVAPWFFSDSYIRADEDADLADTRGFTVLTDRLIISPGYVLGNTMNYSYIVFKNRLY